MVCGLPRSGSSSGYPDTGGGHRSSEVSLRQDLLGNRWPTIWFQNQMLDLVGRFAGFRRTPKDLQQTCQMQVPPALLVYGMVGLES